LYFENKRCKRCEHVLGYIANDFELSALEPAENETWTALAKPGRPGAPATWRFCRIATAAPAATTAPSRTYPTPRR